MDLSFGTNVHEYGFIIGRLAGVEIDRRTRTVRSILVREDGTVGVKIERRPLLAVSADRFDGGLEVRAFASTKPPAVPTGSLTLSDKTRVTQGGRLIGRLCGLELEGENGEIVTIMGRQHWWTRPFHVQAHAVDFARPDEILVSPVAHAA